jgi:2-polyprenyl-3-methyl-5-hydroxy-6-metoxy-1,4-benzoquinol methylase
MINTKHRTLQTEIMDDFSVQGAPLRSALDTLAKVNRYLGGNRLTLSGLKSLLKQIHQDGPIRILDIGCGDGDMLRVIARQMRKKQIKVQLVGIDANEFTIQYAQEKSKDYPEISYKTKNVFTDNFLEEGYDIVLATLFLHHFKEEDIVQLLTSVLEKTKIGILVNDLHRNIVAYYLFKMICPLIPSKMAQEDGLTSVLRGFKKEDLVAMSKRLKMARSSIQWKWAFRYEWIISKQ